MKNQNDLIFSIAFGVVGLGSIAAFFFMKPVPVTPPGPSPVSVTKVALPTVEPVMVDSLGGGSSSGGGSRGGMGGGMGFGGPPSGFGGPPSGFGGPPGLGGGTPGGKNRPGASSASGMGK